MGKLPLLVFKEFSKILDDMGFQIVRQKGSHVFFQHPDGRTTVVPNHPGEEIDRRLLNKIIKHDLKMPREEFMKYV